MTFKARVIEYFTQTRCQLYHVMGERSQMSEIDQGLLVILAYRIDSGELKLPGLYG